MTHSNRLTSPRHRLTGIGENRAGHSGWFIQLVLAEPDRPGFPEW